MITYGVRGVYILIGVALTLFVMFLAMCVMLTVLEKWREDAEREEKQARERGVRSDAEETGPSGCWEGISRCIWLRLAVF